ncbi:MAG: peptidylprolyl isomerase [Pseudomonadota bacterium]|nr:peptidylprolyl isomerase [Magnetococcales bacterium]MEC8067617.1 peptidylprolyl isomerase [Pseudomonadota bacterium]MEC8467113.1 peptidylprolyl isomerase [Pseudomonadota bacterium]|tara:strand:+ start:29636 stop:30100 length:465 start_codon:yes stop_codon:yes gene_type:complete
MSQKVISFHYKLTNTNGDVLDSSEGKEALAFLTGSNQIISGLEKELVEMETGDKKTVTVASDEAYGPKFDDRIADVPREQFPEDVQVGMMFSTDPQGQSIVTVTNVSDDTVTIDANHPLAGEDLTFDVEVTAVREATADEIDHGHAHGEGGVQH